MSDSHGEKTDDQNAADDLVKSSWRMNFSIRTMLIVVAVIAIFVTGGRWWILSNTMYRLDAFVFLRQEEFEKLTKQVEGYEDVYWNMRGYKDQSISYFPHECIIRYESTANYFEVKQKAFELRQELIATVERYPELQFDRYIIRSILEPSGTNRKTIEEGDLRELRARDENNK